MSKIKKPKNQTSPSVGTVVRKSAARREYEKVIDDWVAGRATYEDVMAHDPYRQERSFLGFLHFLFSGQTKPRHR